MKTGYDLTSLSSVGTRTIKYNADNKPVKIIYTKGVSTTVNFSYDGQGHRVLKTSGQGTTYYVGEHYEVVNDAGVKYIFAGNLRIAKIDSSKTSPDRTLYYHKDHRGSTSAMTNENGVIVENTGYRPFGDQRDGGGAYTTGFKFTDQEFDPETGLYDYGARYYDPTIGRFISADSVVPDPFDPQSLNRYTYCRNNPLIYTDPSGHHPIFIAMAIGAVIGGVSAGIRSDWDLGAVAQGAFVGGFSSAVFYAGGEAAGRLLAGTTTASAGGTSGQAAFLSQYPQLASAGDSVYIGNGTWLFECPTCFATRPPVVEGALGGASGGMAASGGGWYSGAKGYLETRTMSNLAAGHRAAAFIDQFGIAAIDLLLPQSAYEVPLMFMGANEIKGIGQASLKGLTKNPFKGQSIEKVRDMLKVKFGEPKWAGPGGREVYFNSRTGTSYHVHPADSSHPLSHVDIRSRSFDADRQLFIEE